MAMPGTWPRRRSAARWAATLLGLATLLGCVPPGDEREQDGLAVVKFDGIHVGEGTGWSGIICRSRSDGTAPWFIVTRDHRWKIGGDQFQDWQVPVRRLTTRASLYLQITPGRPREAAVEFVIDTAVYRSTPETAAKVNPDWEAGRVVFTDVPLAEGKPYRGKRQLERLAIRWSCERT